ncbi:hypothetical protein LXL04_039168 [Taraxacum kok-saghyz]
MLTRIQVHAVCDSRCPNNSLHAFLDSPLHALLCTYQYNSNGTSKGTIFPILNRRVPISSLIMSEREMATSSVTATGFSSSFHGSWGTSMAGEDYGALVAKTTPKLVRIGNPLRYGPMMGNINEGKGPFAPVVVVTRNIVGKKRFNQLRGKAIALHSQVITEFCKSIGANSKQRQGDSPPVTVTETQTIYVSVDGNVENGKGPTAADLESFAQIDPLTGDEASIFNDNQDFQIENLSSVSNDAENSHFWEPLDMSAGPKVEKFKPKAPTRKVENISSEMDYMDNESIPMFSPDELLGSSYNGITDSIPVSDFHVNEEQPPIC